jgi:hypothetical protein
MEDENEMKNYWLSGTSLVNFKVDKGKQRFDKECFSEETPNVKALENKPKENYFIEFIWKENKFAAITKSTGIYIYEPTKEYEGKPKKPNETYPHRFIAIPILIPIGDDLLEIEKVQLRLNFITTKQRAWCWKIAFMPALKPIQQDDFELIYLEMKKSGYYKEVNPY